MYFSPWDPVLIAFVPFRSTFGRRAVKDPSSVRQDTMVADSTQIATPDYVAPHTSDGKRNVQTTVLYFSGDPKVQLEPTIIGG